MNIQTVWLMHKGLLACWTLDNLHLPLQRQSERERETEREMDSLTVVGGGLSVASVHHSGGKRRNWTSSPATRKLMPQSQSLSSLQPSPWKYFSLSQSRRQAKTRVQSTETQIFLPHLVASMEGVEQSYIMIKPDGVQRGLVGEIISRFEKKGFLLKGLKLFQCPKELAETWEGVGVVLAARKLIGATNPLQAEPGTIRGDLAVQTGRNVVHGSDSPENGKREIALWFKEGELCQWSPTQAPWLWE